MTPKQMNDFALSLDRELRPDIKKLARKIQKLIGNKTPELKKHGKGYVQAAEYAMIRARVMELVSGNLEYNVLFPAVAKLK